MFRKLITVVIAVAVIAAFSGFTFANEAATGDVQVKVGGISKLTVFDRVNGGSYVGAAGRELDKTYGVTFKDFNIYINAKMNDLVSFEIDPRFSASTGATPKLGTTTTASSSASASKAFSFSGISHGKAVMILNLPEDVEMEIGILEFPFTVEYGKQAFWSDTYNGYKFAANDNLGSMHESGFQIYKNFDFGDIALPVTLGILNGGSSNNVDVNNTPGVALHIEPTMAGLTLLGSIYATKYDEYERKAMHKWAAGIMYGIGDLNLRSEFVKSKKEQNGKADVTGEDAVSEGYYVTATYKLLEWATLVLHHESALEGSAEGDQAAWGNRYITNIGGININLSDSTIMMCQVEVFDWKNNNGTTKVLVTRPIIGVRNTF